MTLAPLDNLVNLTVRQITAGFGWRLHMDTDDRYAVLTDGDDSIQQLCADCRTRDSGGQ